MRGRRAKTPRTREANGLVDVAGVVDRRSGKHSLETRGQRLSERDGGHRREEKDHAEVAVRVDQFAGFSNRREHGDTDPFDFCAVERGADGQGAQGEVEIVAIGKVGESVNVAGLGSGRFEEARDLGESAGRW